MNNSYTQSLNFYGNTTPQELIQNFGSPLFVYNENLLRTRCKEMKNLVNHPKFHASYSTKANGNPHLLRIIKEEGLYADAMSPGEMALLHMAGFSKKETGYVCNNVSKEELIFANDNASYVSVDSLSQLDTFGKAVPGGRVMARVNPGIGAGHHSKVVTAGKNTKFGISPEDFPQMEEILAAHNLTLIGLNQHVGSLFMEEAPYLAAAAWLLDIAALFPSLEIIDFGGGFGIPYNKYQNQPRLNLHALGEKLTKLITDWCAATQYSGSFVTEPGRYVAAESGILLGTATATKDSFGTRYVGSDLGFSILARPVMYDAFHDIEVYRTNKSDAPAKIQTIVGNICETGDVLAKERTLPEITLGDIIGVLDAGAYGSSMSSNYNQRPRPAEVLICADGTPKLIRMRDNIKDLLAHYPQ